MRPGLVALLVALVVPAAARAQAPAAAPPGREPATCAFKVVHALPDGDGSMDPQINMLREDLKKPPFTAWKTFKLLSRNEQELAEGATASFTTPDGHKALLTYAGHLERAGKQAIRVVLDFKGDKSDARTSLTIDEGGHFVVAGHKWQSGILVYAVSCKRRR